MATALQNVGLTSVPSKTAYDVEFEKQLASHWLAVFHFCTGRLQRKPEDAEDLTQFAMMQAWANREKIRDNPKQNLRAYLMTIARNARYSQYRHEKILTVLSLDSDAHEYVEDNTSYRVTHGLAVSGGQEELIRLHETVKELATLPPGCAAAVVLTARGLTYNQAAAQCGLPVGTIKSRVSRGRKALIAAAAA